MSERVDAAMDRMADLIKDALLDGWESNEEDELPAAPPGPIDPDEFVARLRERVERTLRQAADALNAAPDESSAVAEEATCDLFTELWLEALKLAAEMRLEAVLGGTEPRAHGPHGAGPPHGEWARRYRRMHDDDPE
jgi:hypothetical protein